MSKKTDKKGVGIKPIKRKPQLGEYRPSDEDRLKFLELRKEQYKSLGYCAKELGISIPTIKKYYKSEVEETKEFIKEALKGQLVAQAMTGNTACLIFACKTICGLKETTVVENKGEIPSFIPKVINQKGEVED